MQREAVRVATEILCKILHSGQNTGLGICESEEVGVCMRARARLEHVRREGGGAANGSDTKLGATGLRSLPVSRLHFSLGYRVLVAGC